MTRALYSASPILPTQAAPLDLVEKAGPRATLEHRIRAVAQQKHPLQLGEGPVHRAGAGEGAVVAAFLLLGAAMLLDLRERVIARY